MEEVLAELKKIKGIVAKLEKENKELKKRVSRLEAGTNKDLRIKAKRVLGFTLSNVRGYYNAVRSIQGGQVRIYIGKNTKDTLVRKKIVSYLIDNAYWLRNDIRVCEDLMEIEEIAKAIEKVDAEKENEK